MVSNYSNTCKYSIPLLKNRIYVYDETILSRINVDNGLDDAVLLSTPMLLTGFSISYSEDTSLDERYRFTKNLKISMTDKVDVDFTFWERYFIIVEDYDGNFYLTNPDFQYKYTYSYNLSNGVNQTDITFTTSSNFPLLKIDITPPEYNECKRYKFTEIKSLELIEKKYASYSNDTSILYTTENFKHIDFIKNSLAFKEEYDGEKTTVQLQFEMPLESANVSWDYDLLEFKDNLYTAVISTTDDYRLVAGIYNGLQPNYTINASVSESNSYQITLTETSINASVALQATFEELLGYTWDYIRVLDGNKTYDCNMSHGCGWAQIIVQAEIDAFGNETGRYKLLEYIYDGLYNQTDPDIDYSWFEDNYAWLRRYNIIGSFEDDYPNGWFPTSECVCYNPHPETKCQLITDMPSDINIEGATSTTFSFKASCNWNISDIPSGFTISPISGEADTDYTIVISNSSDELRQGIFKLSCCNSTYIYNLNVVEETECIDYPIENVNCLQHAVEFTIKENCEFEITSIPSGLTYSIVGRKLTVNVPKNDSRSGRQFFIEGVCCGDNITIQINQSGYYTMLVDDGFICSGGTKYVKMALYSGVTSVEWVKTTEYELGEVLEYNSPDCRSIEKYEFVGYTCIDGSKYELLRRFLSWDDGVTWHEQPEVRLGDWIEDDSEFCDQEIQYKWVLTTRTICLDE